MPWNRQAKRTVCSDCGTRYRGVPLEIQLRVKTGNYWVWRWTTRSLCALCKQAQLDYWFSRHDGSSAALPDSNAV